MPRFWALTGRNSSNYVIVLSRDKALLAQYPPASLVAIRARLDSWLTHAQEQRILRDIHHALQQSASPSPKVPQVTTATLKNALINAFQHGRLVASEVMRAAIQLEGVVVASVGNVPPSAAGEELQLLLAMRLGGLTRANAIALIRSGAISDLSNAENHGTGRISVALSDSQYATLMGTAPGIGSFRRAPPQPYALGGRGSRAGNARLPHSRLLAIAAPRGDINKAGFIDHADGSNIRTGPAESGGQKVREAPLPPATRVFVSGTHPTAPDWWYVTAFADKGIFRGYVQGFRVTTDLPEPTAKLYQIKKGDTAEQLAVREFKRSVRGDHDLRYYENVLLFVNRQKGRAGIIGSYQDPNVLGGGSNNIQLVAGRRIWLASPAYAKALESVVPSGSLTGGAVAKLKRFAGHFQDILQSVTDSPRYVDEVLGEAAQAIRDNIVEIVGIIALFILAEEISAVLALSPTGVGQLAALAIQLALAAFGMYGLVEATAAALEHGNNWLTLAWKADGREAGIEAASKEFLKMLGSIAMAALTYLGVKGNMNKALEIAHSLPPPMVPAFAVAGGGQVGPTRASTATAIGPPGMAGPLGTAVMMAGNENNGGSSRSSTADEAATAREAAENAAKRHVHKGELETNPQSPYHGKWSGGGVHIWEELLAICKRDGFRIKHVIEDPKTGVRRVEVERTGIDPKTKLPVTGTIKKTLYPKDFTPSHIDAAGESALQAASKKMPGTKLDPPGLKLKKDGTPVDGFFEATVKGGVPPREVKVQGWYKELPGGTKVITSHAPAFDKSWPAVTL